MKRKLFFWFEKLKISRNERRAVAVLLILLVSLVAINALVKPRSPFDKEYYQALDKRFKQRTAQMERQRQKVLARYQGKDIGLIDESGLSSDTSKRSHIESGSGEPVNINTAGIERLKTLPGIGPAYAGRIIAYRRENGPFTKARDLLKIKGIGPVRLKKISPFITLGDSAGEASGRDSLQSGSAKKAAISSKNIDEAQKINVNTADIHALERLPGIGPVYAGRIIKYRNGKGPFKTKEQLLEIRGIGPKRLAKIKPLIILKE
jgi:competence protein ComEA